MVQKKGIDRQRCKDRTNDCDLLFADHNSSTILENNHLPTTIILDHLVLRGTLIFARFMSWRDEPAAKRSRNHRRLQSTILARYILLHVQMVMSAELRFPKFWGNGTSLAGRNEWIWLRGTPTCWKTMYGHVHSRFLARVLFMAWSIQQRDRSTFHVNPLWYYRLLPSSSIPSIHRADILGIRAHAYFIVLCRFLCRTRQDVKVLGASSHKSWFFVQFN